MRRRIEDDEALPPQPEAKVERLPRVTMAALGLTMQADIKGMQLAFEQHVDATADEATINETIDVWAKVIGRQKAKIDLAEKILALDVCRKQIKSQGDERVRVAASQAAAYEVSGKRSPFKRTGQQQAALDNFDKTIEMMKGDIPILESQIERLRAVVEGRDETEAPLGLAAE